MDEHVVIGPAVSQWPPPEKELVRIVADKVYDSCDETVDQTDKTIVTTGTDKEWSAGIFSVGQVAPSALTVGTEISCIEISRIPFGNYLTRITILVSVPLTLTNPNSAAETVNRVFNFTKTATLNCPPDAEVDCLRSRLNFSSSIITLVGSGSVEVTVDFQVGLIIDCILASQLLVPSYGICTPEPCTVWQEEAPPVPLSSYSSGQEFASAERKADGQEKNTRETSTEKPLAKILRLLNEIIDLLPAK